MMNKGYIFDLEELKVLNNGQLHLLFRHFFEYKEPYGMNLDSFMDMLTSISGFKIKIVNYSDELFKEHEYLKKMFDCFKIAKEVNKHIEIIFEEKERL